MDIQKNDLYFMDYDTYHQVVGGSLLEYIEWLSSIQPIHLEESCKPLLDESPKEANQKESTMDETHNQILLFLLELLGSHYGIIFDSFSNPEILAEEKIQECLRLYQSIGMNQEHTISMVKQYLKDLRRR